MRAARLLVLLLLLVGSHGLGGLGGLRRLRAEEAPGTSATPVDEMEQVVAAADRFWIAFQAGDAGEQATVAQERTLDIVRVLGVLLREHAKDVASGHDLAPKRLTCAEALVEQAAGNPDARGAAEVLTARKSWTEADFAREARLRAAADRIEELETSGDLEGVLAALEAARPDLAHARGSLLACFLQQDIGLIAWRLGRTDDALAATRASRALAALLPWPGGELRALRYEYSLLAERGDLDALQHVSKDARATALSAGWTERALIAGLQTGTHLRLGARYAEALAVAHEMRALATQNGLSGGAAQALLSEAKTLAVMGERTQASALAEQVLADPTHAADAALKVEALTVLGHIFSHADRFAEALDTVERALALLEGRDEPVLLAHLWTNKGIYHRRLGQLDDALVCQEKAVREAERAVNPLLLGTALGNLGVVQKQLKNPGYRATLQKALEAKRKGGDQIGMLETALNLAGELVEQPATRAQGFRMLEQVVGSLEKARVLPQLAAAWIALSQAQHLAGDDASASATAARALETLQSLDDRSMRLALAHESHATALMGLERPAEALTAALEAVRVRRSLAAGLGEEDASGLVESARRASDLALACAHALARAEPSRAAEATSGAFEALEAGRATLLAAGVVSGEALLAAEVPPALVRAEAGARSKVAGARARLVSVSSRPTRDAAQLSQARGQLESAWKDYAAIVGRIQREAQRAAGVVFPATLALPDLQKRLPAGSAFVAYQLGAQAASALVVRPDGAHLVVLEGAADLPTRVEQYVGLVSAPESDDAEAAADLYDALLRPLEPHLGGVERLLVAPDGALTFLPFEALRRVEDARAQRVVERWQVAYVPSATVFASLSDEHAGSEGRGFVGLGDPTYGQGGPGAPALTPIPRSGDEVRAIGALFPAAERTLLLGKDARLARLLAALPKTPQRLRTLHLACHAFVDAERPRLSALALAGGDTLDLDAVYRLRVPADLCVLSACATARGRWQQGEGVLGFVRGFFFAGVPRVVVSDWVVEDASARALMEAFHAGVMRRKLGASAALREAKLQALKAGGAAAHPSSWAAFVLWGLPE